jgi:hypothetical protein
MTLLDTTFPIHYWQGVEEVAAYLDSHEADTFVTTTLNLREHATGRALQGEFDHNELCSTFDWVTVLAFEDHSPCIAATSGRSIPSSSRAASVRRVTSDSKANSRRTSLT